jgi:hypothetical protein
VETLLGINDWSKIGASAALFSAIVLFYGGYLAQRYGHCADTSIKARAFRRSGGDSGLHIQVRVKCVGLSPIRITNKEGKLPELIIMEVRDNGHEFNKFKGYEITAKDLIGLVAGPGESINWMETVHLRPAKKSTAGWTVQFRFSTRRRYKRWKYWTYSESTFVPNRNVKR